MSCSADVQDRIIKVFCGDCPGLSASKVASDEFRKMQRKLTVLIPQSSYIGVMFEKGERYTVVKSVGRGLRQHNPYTWVLDGPDFIKLDSLSEQGKRNEMQFRARMEKMSGDEKRELVETLFEIVESTGARTLSEISASRLQTIILAVKTYSGLEREKKNIVNKWLMDFLKR